MSQHSEHAEADLFEIMTSRQSVRAFSTEPIALALVERAVEAAGWAPSPHGTQPWRFVLLSDHHLRYGLAEAMGDSWRDQLRSDGVSESEIEDRVRLSKDRLERAPVVAVLCLHLGDAHPYPDASRQDSERLMAIQSLGAAAQNFLLMLEAQKLASGWMCAPLFCPAVIVDYLQLPQDLEPQAMFPIGKMARPPKRRTRRPVETLIFRPGRS